MSETTNTIQKPLAILLRETKQKLVTSINSAIQESGLPLFLLEPMFKEVYVDVVNSTEAEYKSIEQQYNQELAKATEQSNEDSTEQKTE